MKMVGTVIASVSRSAGGLFESVRYLTSAVLRQGTFENIVFGLADEHSAADKNAWEPIETHVLEVVGPRSLGYAPALYQSMAGSNLDIIHNHGIWMYPSVAVARYARRHSIPYVVSPHGMLDPWAVSNSRLKKQFARIMYEDNHLRNAACLRALCDSEAASMRAFGLKNPICIIPNGMDLPNTGDTTTPAWLEQVPSSKKILLYLGRIHPKKGLPNLLQAWASLAKGNAAGAHQWHLVIAGWDQGGHQQELMSLANYLCIKDSVSFVGPQFAEAKRASYSQADAFILPSYSEGLPMVVLEAWSYGLPVVMTPECNLPEGYQASAAIKIQTDVADIAKGLDELFIFSEAEQSAMGMRGRALVESRFAWSQIGADMTRVYEWILGGGPAPACVQR
jgi:glycosyltransferase involved in cell wall biosynthesis